MHHSRRYFDLPCSVWGVSRKSLPPPSHEASSPSSPPHDSYHSHGHGRASGGGSILVSFHHEAPLWEAWGAGAEFVPLWNCRTFFGLSASSSGKASSVDAQPLPSFGVTSMRRATACLQLESEGRPPTCKCCRGSYGSSNFGPSISDTDEG